jgi:tetratricopeptide (TPR) repeat protein
MNSRTKASVGVGLLLFSSLSLSVLVLRKSDEAREPTILKESLYIPSAKAVKALSLGYTGLMADLYWTRVVQYFGGKHHQRADQYKLLAPLLDITTTLDPHLMIAYEFGSIFLAQKPPEGAGDPEAAVALVKKGIRENPEAWRLWYHLGYIYFDELHDSKTASEVFLQGSQVPGALPWMKVLAAALAQHAGEAETARYLWTQIYNSSNDPNIRANAVRRLLALRVDQEVTQLQELADRYRRETATVPGSFLELVQAGYLHGLPVDPLGNPYLLLDGRVQVSSPDSLPFITKGLPPGQKPSMVARPKSGSS